MAEQSNDIGDLRQRCLRANHDLVAHGLVLFTWGNASVLDRAENVMLIKPSGVDYEVLTADKLVAVRLADGSLVQPKGLKPSSDTATHLALYRAWPGVRGIVHTHSEYATAAAQACVDIPAQGTTHADYFYGPIPCTRALTDLEINGAYEANTGAVIVETYAQRKLDPLAIPGCVVSQHAPFAWGATVEKAVYHAAVLERLARMAVHTATLNARPPALPQHLLDKHYLRKHGRDAYYGQN